ncbi:hypothetical protein [Streptomyces sp. x-19]|uniref:hypothetical protein n=1 Tax=Streptomyces sp. x-19 TaxID=2789280 RepID=UPI00397FC366
MEPGKTIKVMATTGEVGVVDEIDRGGAVWLRPPQGGPEWPADPSELREPTERERAKAFVLMTPVGQSR